MDIKKEGVQKVFGTLDLFVSLLETEIKYPILQGGILPFWTPSFYMTDSFYPRTIHLTDIQPTAGIHGFYCSHYNYPYRKHYSTPDYNGPRT